MSNLDRELRKKRRKDGECAICQGMSPREFDEETGDNILQYGRSVLGVLGDDEKGIYPFSYTIGNQAKGLPELLIIGSKRGQYLNELSEKMIAQGKAFDHGAVFTACELLGFSNKQLRVKIVNASEEAIEHYTCQATNYYDAKNYRVQQVILSDKEGKFPGEPGCDKVYAAVPILAASPPLKLRRPVTIK